ncbi:hypothetical protein DEU56DRAFT_755946, partial [Suillus clintonianus]
KTSQPAAQIAEGSEDETPNGIATKASHHARGFGPHSARRGLEHLRTPTAERDQVPKKTKAVRAASPTEEDRSPKKTRVTRSAAKSVDDAPAQRTRSKADTSLGPRARQKPQRYIQ